MKMCNNLPDAVLLLKQNTKSTNLTFDSLDQTSIKMKDPDAGFDIHYCNKQADLIFDIKLSDLQNKENLTKSKYLLLQK